MECYRVELALSYAAERIGVSSLNEKEKQTVQAFEGKDVFMSLPTGYGKSVCFRVYREQRFPVLVGDGLATHTTATFNERFPAGVHHSHGFLEQLQPDGDRKVWERGRSCRNILSYVHVNSSAM